MIDLYAAATSNGMRARIKGSAPELVEGLPHLARWAGEMASRPAMQRALKF